VRPSGHFVVICRAAPGSRLPRHRRRSLLRDVGLGSDAWDRLFGQPRPAELHSFGEIKAGSRQAIATPGDLLFHIRAKRMYLCFELAEQIMARLGDSISVVDEVHGFRYFDDRDLIGFVDGTENPTGQTAIDAAYIGAEDALFAWGSYVIVQKYLHDLAGWNALSTEAQERIIGRPPGNYDRLLDFSFAKTGNLFFVPSAAFLENVGSEASPATQRTIPWQSKTEVSLQNHPRP
jgi:Dyp-type peroxidase family